MPNDREITQQEQTNAPIESKSFKKKSKIRLLFARRHKLVAFLIVAILLVAGGLGFLVYKKSLPKQKIVFVINSKKYTDTEVAKLIDWPVKRKQSKDEASKLAYDYLKQKQAADNLGIEVTPQEINNAVKKIKKNNLGSFDANNPWIQLVAYSNALNEKIMVQSGSSPKGYSFIFYFGNKLEKRPFEKEQIAGFGDKEMIEADKKYAKERADFYKDQLDNRKISTEEAYNQVKKDPKLGLNYTANTNFSSHFGTKPDTSWESEVFYQDVLKDIKSQQVQGVTQIKTGKTATVEMPKSDSDYQETFYFFVVLDQPAKLFNKEQLDKAINTLKADYYGYK